MRPRYKNLIHVDKDDSIPSRPINNPPGDVQQAVNEADTIQYSDCFEDLGIQYRCNVKLRPFIPKMAPWFSWTFHLYFISPPSKHSDLLRRENPGNIERMPAVRHVDRQCLG